MDDYIKREDALNTFSNAFYAGLAAKIKAIPPEDVAPVRHGHWILPNKEKTDRPLPECSCCGWYVSEGAVLDFTDCPNCGAKMDEGV